MICGNCKDGALAYQEGRDVAGVMLHSQCPGRTRCDCAHVRPQGGLHATA